MNYYKIYYHKGRNKINFFSTVVEAVNWETAWNNFKKENPKYTPFEIHELQ